jgi:hypothetical protein
MAGACHHTSQEEPAELATDPVGTEPSADPGPGEQPGHPGTPTRSLDPAIAAARRAWLDGKRERWFDPSETSYEAWEELGEQCAMAPEELRAYLARWATPQLAEHLDPPAAPVREGILPGYRKITLTWVAGSGASDPNAPNCCWPFRIAFTVQVHPVGQPATIDLTVERVTLLDATERPLKERGVRHCHLSLIT